MLEEQRYLLSLCSMVASAIRPASMLSQQQRCRDLWCAAVPSLVAFSQELSFRGGRYHGRQLLYMHHMPR